MRKAELQSGMMIVTEYGAIAIIRALPDLVEFADTFGRWTRDDWQRINTRAWRLATVEDEQGLTAAQRSRLNYWKSRIRARAQEAADR